MKKYNDAENEETTLQLLRGQHLFTINPEEDSRLVITLKTDITIDVLTHPKNQEIVLDQELTLHSCENSVSITFQGLTPAVLRKLASELEQEISALRLGSRRK